MTNPTKTSRFRRPGLVLLLGGLAAFPPLSIDMYLPTFPTLQAQFEAEAGSVQATLAVFFIGLAVGQAVYGPVSDRLGRRPPLIFGIALYIAASLAAVQASGIAGLMIARLAQALGGCAAVVIARAIVADLFKEREMGRVFSLLVLVTGLAPILAPLIGGRLLGAFGWKSIFWVLAAFAVLCLCGVVFGLEETLPRRRRSVGGVGGAFLAYRGLLKDRPFLGLALASGLAMAGMFAYIAGSPFVFMSLYGVSARSFGFLFGGNALGLMAAAQINRVLLRRRASGAILTAALGVYLLAGLILGTLGATGAGGLVGLLIPLFMVIGSLGFIAPNATALAMARASSRAGAASALLGVIQFGAGAASASLVGAFNDGTAGPMSVGIAGLAIAAFLIGRWAVASAKAEEALSASRTAESGEQPCRANGD
jgi:DHA1 family bicyclomycin/chloramphenicol resistance-like MFS transporter